MSLELEYHTNWIFTQIRVSLKYECHSNWKTKWIEKVVNPQTSKSASIGQILVLFALRSVTLLLSYQKLFLAIFSNSRNSASMCGSSNSRNSASMCGSSPIQGTMWWLVLEFHVARIWECNIGSSIAFHRGWFSNLLWIRSFSTYRWDLRRFFYLQVWILPF